MGMTTLARELRSRLESEIGKARRVAEKGARQALEELAVGEARGFSTFSDAQKELRKRLRTHGRQLGDRRDDESDTQAIQRITQECAYEHWHRMLFARFLAENELLIEPISNEAITLEECQGLARSRGEDWITVASMFAVRMLPQIFRQGDPVLDVALPPETRSELEDILKKLPRDVFLADDSLGWVYQFWQADEKKRINDSEIKIGADELPAVTQLFTEDYMVLFLLHNTLGAWWAGKILAQNPELARSAKSEDELRAACSVGGVKWNYLRFVRDDFGDSTEGPWRPAAGNFDRWPKIAKEITLLDPCMGSGHFLVFALPILAAFRMTEENLSREAAVDAVLRDNLFGLEIDQRCTQIAAFNLAFSAWRTVGFRQLPPLNLACSGLAPGVSRTEWVKLAERVALLASVPPERNLFASKGNLFSQRIKDGIARLYDLFAKASWLGSLIDPRAGEAPLAEATFSELQPVLTPMLLKQDDELAEVAVTARGMAKAADILGRHFTLVVTNVPYLKRGKQTTELQQYSDSRFPNSKGNLGCTFFERCLRYCGHNGSIAVVCINELLFRRNYKTVRQQLLEYYEWEFIARLGPRAFQAISGERVNVSLYFLSIARPSQNSLFSAIDVSDRVDTDSKAVALKARTIGRYRQANQLHNPDHRIVLEETQHLSLLSGTVQFGKGSTTGDSPHYHRYFWELPALTKGVVVPWLDNPKADSLWSGRSLVSIVKMDDSNLRMARGAFIRGHNVWGRRGIALNKMGSFTPVLYTGEVFDDNVGVLATDDPNLASALLCYIESGEYLRELRKIDQALNVTAASLTKVPFDLDRWREVAKQKYPKGLPQPHSNDPTQWLFSGRLFPSDQPLQVAVARLLAYEWPRQTGFSFVDCPAVGGDGLEKHADSDGIVCLSPIKGQPSAEQRLRTILADAFASDWSAVKLSSLLAEVGFANISLDDWLRDGFFAQHCELFHQRPFLWHIWDGRRDGFNVLVNYHRLAAPNGGGHRTLEKLIYTYLGAWVDLQREAQRQGADGADARLAAAEHLKHELENILAGEPPYDIFVRWKPLHEQPIGWEPDINDGVRINIRPFTMARPLGAKAANASILRVTPKIKWDKDRGKEPQRSREDFPWFWGWDGKTDDFAGRKSFEVNRWNDLHYTNKFKQAARQQHSAPLAKAAT
jgi:hypothetical protein